MLNLNYKFPEFYKWAAVSGDEWY